MLRIITILVCLLSIARVQAVSSTCESGMELTHTFNSGASWTLCAEIEDRHALELSNLHYHAPGDSRRLVLASLHLAQILQHYHEDTQASTLIDDAGLGAENALVLSERMCRGELHATNGGETTLCTEVSNLGLMAKYSLRPGLQGQQWHLFSVSKRQNQLLKISVLLTEDGRIRPTITLSGRTTRTTMDTRFGAAVPAQQERLSRATFLSTWRIAFALDGNADDDRVEEFEFKLNRSAGGRRPMTTTTLNTEAFRTLARENFRGWRVVDQSGRGYYLDPQSNGYNFLDRRYNWAQFALALTRENTCEKHALQNQSTEPECGKSIDDFISGQSLENQPIVLWYSQSRVYHPVQKTYPPCPHLK